MEQGYWSTISSHRASRRRALGVAGGAGAALLLAACGGSDGGEPSQTGSGVVSQAEDTFKQAKRGGILKHANTQEPPSLEFGSPLRGHPGANSISSFLRFEQGK